jgi:hypothetical protein
MPKSARQPKPAEPEAEARATLADCYEQAYDIGVASAKLDGLVATLSLVAEGVDIEHDPNMHESLGWLRDRLAEVSDDLMTRLDKLERDLHKLQSERP